MYEVEQIKETNALLDKYESEFFNKYKTKPSVDSFDRTFLKDLLKKHGHEKAWALIEQFFKSQNEWFKKKAHSLIVLKNNLNVVIAELGQRQQIESSFLERQPNRGLMIQIKGYCINKECLNRFDVICNSNDVEEKTWSEHCGLCSFGEEQYA